MDLSGIAVPLPTPFTDDGSKTSEVRLSRLIRHFSHQGADALVVCSDTGEFSACGVGERKELLELTIRDAKGIPVLVNVSSMSTAVSLDLAQHAKRHGARAAVCAPPIYGELTEDEITGYFTVLGQHGNLPIIVVDPSHKLTDSITHKLADTSTLILAEPAEGGLYEGSSRTDEFRCKLLTCSPLAAFATLADWPKYQKFSEFASPRVVKAALEVLEFELGSVRGPRKWLPATEESELRSLIRECQRAAQESRGWPFDSSAA